MKFTKYRKIVADSAAKVDIRYAQMFCAYLKSKDQIRVKLYFLYSGQDSDWQKIGGDMGAVKTVTNADHYGRVWSVNFYFELPKAVKVKRTERTDWFDNFKHFPVNEGVYEIQTDITVQYARWQNGQWHLVCKDRKLAQMNVSKSFSMYCMSFPWRGFVEKQDG